MKIKNRFTKILALFLCLHTQASFAHLSIEEVLQSVNRHYPEILAARQNVRKAQGELISAWGAFDPSLQSQSRSLPMGGYQSNALDSEISVPTLTQGLRFFAGYRIGQGNYPVYYQNYLTNSGGEYRAGLSLPLLRDRNIDKSRTELLNRKTLVHVRNQEVGALKLMVYQQTIHQYWRWVQAGITLDIFQQLLHLAQTRQAALVKQAALGDLAKLSVIENQQIILQRQQMVVQAHMELDKAAIALSLFYRDKIGKPIIPAPNSLPALTMPQKQLISKTIMTAHAMLDKHPEVQRLGGLSKIATTEHHLARNELLPQLDTLAFTSKQYGTGGYPLLIPEAAQIGVRFLFPLYQREAKGKLISTASDIRRLKIEQRFVYEKLLNQLGQLAVGLRRLYKQHSLLRDELVMAKAVQRGEFKKFKSGDSSIFLVNQREQITTQTKLNLAQTEIFWWETLSLIRFFTTVG